jgi:hypothetical protein
MIDPWTLAAVAAIVVVLVAYRVCFPRTDRKPVFGILDGAMRVLILCFVLYAVAFSNRYFFLHHPVAELLNNRAAASVDLTPLGK